MWRHDPKWKESWGPFCLTRFGSFVLLVFLKASVACCLRYWGVCPSTSLAWTSQHCFALVCISRFIPWVENMSGSFPSVDPQKQFYFGVFPLQFMKPLREQLQGIRAGAKFIFSSGPMCCPWASRCSVTSIKSGALLSLCWVSFCGNVFMWKKKIQRH